MSGRPGRSGGANRKPLAVHLAAGTYRQDRHGPLPWGPQARPIAPPEADGPAPDALVEGLSGRGLEFVQQCWTRYSGWDPSALALLHEAGRLKDELDTVRGQPEEKPAQRLLVTILAALKLEG